MCMIYMKNTLLTNINLESKDLMQHITQTAFYIPISYVNPLLQYMTGITCARYKYFK